MAEPVTIGKQTFIKTAEGWVDKKTKVRAPESLFTLLNSLTTESNTEYKKLRVRIDSSMPPVTLGGEEYVFDLNQSKWINKKTRDAVNDTLQKIINGVLEKLETEKASAAPVITAAMGTVGQVAKTAVKKPEKPVVDIKINSPIVKMIETLATIDGYLKQRLDNQKKIAARNLAAAKEASIEVAPGDATPVQEVKTEDAEKSNTGSIAAALIVGGLIAAQFEPVQDAFKGLVDGIKGVWNFVSNVAGTIADGLEFFTGKSSSAPPPEQQTVPSSSNQTPLQRSEPTPVTDTPEAQPSEPNKADASPVSNSQENRVETSPSTSDSGNIRLGRTIVGAATGGAIAGPVGAVVGGAVGFFSAPSTPSSPPSSATPVNPSSASTPSNSSSTRVTSQTSTSSNSSQTDQKQTATSIPQNNIVELGRYLQSQGFRVSGHSQFGGQERGSHSANSRHYRDMAIDVNVGTGVTEADDPTAGAKFDKLATDLRAAGYSVIWRAKDHYDHLHASVGGPEGAGSSGENGGALGMVQGAAGAAWDIGAKTIESIGEIISTGLGRMSGRKVTDSLIQTVPDKARGITEAAVKKNAAVAEMKTPPMDIGPLIKDPPNVNKTSNPDFVQNDPTISDVKSTDYYLIRMGFAPRQVATAR